MNFEVEGLIFPPSSSNYHLSFKADLVRFHNHDERIDAPILNDQPNALLTNLSPACSKSFAQSNSCVMLRGADESVMQSINSDRSTKLKK